MNRSINQEMKVQEKRASQSHGEGAEQEHKMMTRKQKADSKTTTHDQTSSSPSKKPKSENQQHHDGEHKTEQQHEEGGDKSTTVDRYDELCKVTRESLSVEQMRDFLKANRQDSDGSDDVVVRKWYAWFNFF